MQRADLTAGFIRLLLLTFTLFLASSASAQNREKEIAAWLEKQSEIKTWTAEFTQTRTLKSFAHPLKAEGRVWFSAPNQFRWELGEQTIAVRQPDQMLVLYPKLKRVEKYPLSGNQMGPWRDALSLLEAGFPRSQKELDAQFKIRSITETDGITEVAMEPKSSAARKMMPQIKIAFTVTNFQLRATELHFADGSIMRNDFRNSVLNEPINPDLFTPAIPSDFKIIEPLKK